MHVERIAYIRLSAGEPVYAVMKSVEKGVGHVQNMIARNCVTDVLLIPVK